MATYRYFISSSGSDANSGLSGLLAWQTMANCAATINGLTNGDTCVFSLKEGETITLAATMTLSLAKTVNVSFSTYGGLDQGGRAYINWTGGNTNLFTMSGNLTSAAYGWTFSNLDINGNNTAQNIFNVDTGAFCYLVVTNCRMHHVSQGQGIYTNKGRAIFMNATSNVCTLLCTDSSMEFIGNDAISAFGSNTMTVRRCNFANIGDLAFGSGEGDGVTTHTNATATVTDCTFYKCMQGGVYFTNKGGTNYVARCFFYQCFVGGIIMAVGATGTGTGGTCYAIGNVVIQPPTAFQLDDFGNGQTQALESGAAGTHPCMALLGTTSATDKDCTLKAYNNTLWLGMPTGASATSAIQIGDASSSYFITDIRNNLICMQANGSLSRAVIANLNSACTTVTIDRNTYWGTYTAATFRLAINGVTASGTFANWQSTAATGSGFNWRGYDANSNFYSGASDNLTTSNVVYGLRDLSVVPTCGMQVALGVLNTGGKIGNTSGVDTAGFAVVGYFDYTNRYIDHSNNNFYRGALGPLRFQ